ncbi:MAG: hypothetical protein QOI16_1378, partial [Pseudonocardiales bacterium]|nr:hypothetical protein [Pseudonocardiales bacterium]
AISASVDPSTPTTINSLIYPSSLGIPFIRSAQRSLRSGVTYRRRPTRSYGSFFACYGTFGPAGAASIASCRPPPPRRVGLAIRYPRIGTVAGLLPHCMGARGCQIFGAAQLGGIDVVLANAATPLCLQVLTGSRRIRGTRRARMRAEVFPVRSVVR